MSKAQGEKGESSEDRPTGTGEKLERSDSEKSETSGWAEEPRRRTSGGGDLTIYLFGRTGREKEAWFRRFLLASKLKADGRGSGLAASCKSGLFRNIPRSQARFASHTVGIAVVLILYNSTASDL